MLLAATAPPALAYAADPPAPADSAKSKIFDPATAPEITIHVKGKKNITLPHYSGGETVVTAKTIDEHPAAAKLSDVVIASVPGALALPDGEMRIRDSDNQYAYYLDGAPLPPSVSGSFSDQVNPRDIETLRVFTGGFPAEFGGQLGAIFDVTARAGTAGKPEGAFQQFSGSESSAETTAHYSGRDRNLSYFISGIRNRTNIRLSPVTQNPLHDGGKESVGFAKFDYNLGGSDRLTLDAGANAATIQIPNTPDRQELGQDDVQSEDGTFANLIWRHAIGPNAVRLALYSHNSHLRNDGSPADLLPSPGDTSTDGLISTFQNLTSNYLGLRGDYFLKSGRDHRVQFGFDVNRVTGKQDFRLVSPPDTGFDPIVDNESFSGGDRAVYVQDDWTTGRAAINMGLRYDVHHADITSSQLSPRMNMRYHLNGRDMLHVYYDRLFQPIALEEVKNLVGQSSIGDSNTVAPLLPERDTLYEIGWERHAGARTLAVTGYYKTSRDIRDDESLGNTQIDIPVNETKAFIRGIEISTSGPVSDALAYHVNGSASWARAAGPLTGGLFGDITPPGYFIDDHDQTYSASFGLSYEHHDTWASLDGEYGSGMPYGEVDDNSGKPVLLNYLRVPSHIILNVSAGTPVRGGVEIGLTINNLFNHSYVIKQAGPFSNVQWAHGRAVGLKLTQRF